MGADAERLLDAFARGRLLRPSASAPNTVDLALALGSLAGAPVIRTPNADRIASLIGPAEHLVFVLVDGMGQHIVRRLDDGCFLRRHTVMELQSVAPSATTAALTTLATGLWPGDHGVLGWWTYLRARDLSVVTLPFIERHSQRPAGEFGLRASDLYPRPPMVTAYGHEPQGWLPSYIANSVYSRYTSGGRENRGYRSLRRACEEIAARVRAATAPTWSYLYVPFVDTAEHEDGASAARPLRVLRDVAARLAALREALDGRARVVVSADHGQIDVPPAQVVRLARSDPLMPLLLAPPSGEPRLARWHVRPGRGEAFARAFRARIGARFVLLSQGEAEDLRLFGPGPLGAEARERCGDYVSIPLDASSIWYEQDGTRGDHGAFTAEEMQVPLVVA